MTTVIVVLGSYLKCTFSLMGSGVNQSVREAFCKHLAFEAETIKFSLLVLQSCQYLLQTDLHLILLFKIALNINRLGEVNTVEPV